MDDAAPDDTHPLDPSPAVLAELDRLNAACQAAPADIPPQIALWTAVAALDRWVFINRGTAEAPRPYAIAADEGHMLCIYSSATRAAATARSSGFVAADEAAALFSVPLPAALDWVLSFGERGVVGVVIDYPELGAWSPLRNLARFAPPREH
ncbi:hypothetical protein [Herbiconiux liukaitaii]|uniref:hypothetical protein n=1 Tax=Herbiconiux liukaitaii TaxID=3342799 RepID=UPI0035BADC78